MKKIVIRVITYNQEKEIGRSLDSLLCQKYWGLYQIIVSDDCSKDHTWDILQEYQAKYPDIVFIYRNEHNLGIYGNVAKSESYLPSEYDLFGELSGDDTYCDGYFESVQKLIKDKEIDTKEAVGIFSDWKYVFPNGKESVFRQNAVLSGYNLWSLKARGKITGRSLLVSKKVHDGYEPILTGKGLNLTESHHDAQAHLNIKRAYYIPRVTTTYYSGIGVSSRLSVKESTYLTTQSVEKWNYAIDNYINGKRDLHYVKYELLKADFYIKPSLWKLCKILYYYEKGQLPGCRNTYKETYRIFSKLLKYCKEYEKN